MFLEKIEKKCLHLFLNDISYFFARKSVNHCILTPDSYKRWIHLNRHPSTDSKQQLSDWLVYENNKAYFFSSQRWF